MLRKDLKVGDVFTGTVPYDTKSGGWRVVEHARVYGETDECTMQGDAKVTVLSGPSFALQTPKADLPKPDMVNAPSHYTRLSPEPMQVIEAWELDFQLGSALKYLARAGHKGGPEDEVLDLKKSVSFINRRIQRLEAKLKK